MDELDVSDFKYGGVNLTGTADSAPSCRLRPRHADSAAALLHDGLLHYGGGVCMTGAESA